MTNSISHDYANSKDASFSLNDKLLSVSNHLTKEKYISDDCKSVRLGTYKTSAQTAQEVLNKKQSNKKTPKTKKTHKTTLNDLRTIANDHGIGSYEFQVCNEFLDYIDKTHDSHIIANGIAKNGKHIDHDFGYPHRYTEKYIKGRFAKLYLLDDWYKLNQSLPMTFLTLTTTDKPDNMLHLDEGHQLHSIHDSFERLQKGKRLLFREMLRKHKGLQYVSVTEPQKSGNPHNHIIIFATFPIEEQIEYRKMWEKWNIGSFEHGLDFDERQKSGKIKSLRNYLMKYMAKSFIDYKSKYDKPIWNKEQLLFNAVAWKYGFRTWCASHKLTQIMSYKPEHVDGIEWTDVILTTPDTEVELWNKKEKDLKESEKDEQKKTKEKIIKTHEKIKSSPEETEYYKLWKQSVDLKNKNNGIITVIKPWINPKINIRPNTEESRIYEYLRDIT